MSISANKMIPGATTLTFRNLAQVQADIAQMEKDNLALFSGTNGKGNFFDVEKLSMTESLKSTNQAADKQATLGWAQLGESGVSVLGQAGGLIAGSIKSSPLINEAQAYEDKINPSGPMKATITPVDPKPTEPSAILGGTVTPPAPGADPSSSATELTESEKAEKAAATKKLEEKNAADKENRALAEGKRTQAANIESRMHNIGQLAGNGLSGGFKTWQGYLQKNITQNQGMAQFLQGSGEMTKQVAGMTTSALQAELSQEQAAASAFQGIVSLTGATRG